MDFETEAKKILEKKNYDVYDLAEIVSLLRSENGCPWDKVQTHETIKKDFLEETYEVIEAIDCASADMLKEELGDVLLQVVFHADIEKQSGRFDLNEIADGVCKKLILRHPHVFADVKADTPEEVLKNWDAIKKEEKHQETYTDTLKSVPVVFPALMRAQKLGKRSFRAREDYSSDTAGQLKALIDAESLTSGLRDGIVSGDKDKQNEYLGDLLFACCNLARTLGLDAEQALTDSGKRFTDRFEQAEIKAKSEGKELSEISFDEADKLWKMNA